MTSEPPSVALLAQRIAAVMDLKMRVAYVKQLLLGLAPEAGADLLAAVTAKLVEQDPSLERLMMALSIALADPELNAHRRAMSLAAHALGHVEVHEMLRQKKDMLSDEEAEALQRVPDFGLGRPVSLGERKTLARTHDRNLIARVVRDPHPDVIRILLGNPRVTEDDVVRIAARRPIAEEVVRELFRSTKWVVRARVRLAIVRNPYTPLDMSLQLVPHLSGSEAREIGASPELPDSLREACRRRIHRELLH